MKGSRFIPVKPGQLFLYGGETYRITRNLTMTSVLGARLSDGAVAVLDIPALRQMSVTDAEGKPVPELSGKDPLAYTTEEWAEGQKRFRVIDRLLKNPNRSRTMVEEMAASHFVSPSTIYRWMSEFLESGHVGSLVPSPRGRKPGSKYIDAKVEAVIQDVVAERYMRKKVPDKQKDIIADIRERCRIAKLPIPNPGTIRLRIKAVPESERMKAAGLRREYADTKGPITGHHSAGHPMEIVQIDHMLAKIDLVDDVHRLPLKRPWITLAIDVFSRMVVGFHISFERPSALAAGMCVSMAMCPKEELLAKLGVGGTWPVWGRIGALHADNAKEFRGKSLKQSCAEYAINAMFRPVRRPRFGGHVERLARTLGQLIRELPGAIRDKRRSDGAALTLKEFEIEFVDMVVNKYHERPHSELGGRSPRATWEAAVVGDGFTPGTGIPPIPGDPELVRIDFLPYFRASIQRYGVRIGKISYYSEVFDRRIREIDPETKKLRKFIFRWDHRDISRIYFYDNDAGRYFVVPYANVALPPISIWEYKAIRAAMNQDGVKGQRANEHTIFEYEARMRRRSDEATARTKTQRSMTQRRKATAEVHREGAAVSKTLTAKHSPPAKASSVRDVPKPSRAAEATFADLFDGPIMPFDGREASK